MKKFLLSFFVIVSFIAYSFHEQTESSEVKVNPPSLPPVTPTPGTQQSSSGSSQTSSLVYRDGIYTGDIVDAYYGNIQVRATITGGKISDIEFLKYPSERRTSIEINTQAMPYLKQEAISAQNSQVDIVSGATSSSQAFRESLQSALNQAKS